MVAQYLAHVAFESTVSRIRGAFFEANVPVVVSLMVPLITPVDEMQMKPHHDGSFDHWNVDQEPVEG